LLVLFLDFGELRHVVEVLFVLGAVICAEISVVFGSGALGVLADRGAHAVADFVATGAGIGVLCVFHSLFLHSEYRI
jgi:hypothetical protein